MGIFKGGLTDLRTRKDRGFTLVELLVVIAIIGILATLVLLQLGTARARARDTQRISHVSQIRTAIEQYYDDNSGTYPDDLTDANLGNYLTKIPTDPLRNDGYCYAYDAGGTGYAVWTQLEQNAAALKNDADIVDKGVPGSWSAGASNGTECTPGVITTDDADCPDDADKDSCVYDQGIEQ